VLEDGRWKELAGAADGGVLRQVLVDFVAQKGENIQAQSALLDLNSGR